METHQTTDLGIAGSIPAGLVFLYDINMIDTTQQTKKQRNKETKKKKQRTQTVLTITFSIPTPKIFLYSPILCRTCYYVHNITILTTTFAYIKIL